MELHTERPNNNTLIQLQNIYGELIIERLNTGDIKTVRQKSTGKLLLDCLYDGNNKLLEKRYGNSYKMVYSYYDNGITYVSTYKTSDYEDTNDIYII